MASCRHCNKQYKSNRSLTRHKCRVQSGVAKKKHFSPGSYTNRQRPAEASAIQSRLPLRQFPAIDDTVNEGLLPQTVISHHDSSQHENELILDRRQDDGVDLNNFVASVSNVATSILQSRRTVLYPSEIVSYSRSVRTSSFPHTAQDLAGQPLSDHEHSFGDRMLDLVRKSQGNGQYLGLRNIHYAPFRSEFEYSFVTWVLRSKVTKGAMDDLLQDRFMKSIQERLSFKTTVEMFSLINTIPYGINDDSWLFTVLDVGVENGDSSSPATCKVWYRPIEDVLRFLLGFPPFTEHLRYQPERHFDSSGHRMYHEMHTGNWWWRVQDLLEDKQGTVVPVLVASDQTLLSNHHGDQKAWAVYVTIGNLTRQVRMKYSLPSLVLIGFLPIEPGARGQNGLTLELYHSAMRVIFQPLEKLAHTGIPIRCADGNTRQCYPILAGFIADYEEQVIMTGIKKGQQCPICLVPREERENLYPTRPYPRRLHGRTLRQICGKPAGTIRSWDGSGGTSPYQRPSSQLGEDSDDEQDVVSWRRSHRTIKRDNVSNYVAPESNPNDMIDQDSRRLWENSDDSEHDFDVGRRQRLDPDFKLSHTRVDAIKKGRSSRGRNQSQESVDKMDTISTWQATEAARKEVHPIMNFAWKHRFADIHQTMMPDILHQLLKGLIMYLVDFIKIAVLNHAIVKPIKNTDDASSKVQGKALTGTDQLDLRFSLVPHFSGLRRFKRFSNISQWSGDEQRAIVKQIIPVMTPLFIKTKPEYIHAARAMVDFYLLANSTGHSEATLRYMKDALYRIDLLKFAFDGERVKSMRNGTTDADRHHVAANSGSQPKPHYNYPKLHQITHYMEQIRLFGSPNGFSTNRPEVGHKDEIKAFYPRTNKKDEYVRQLIAHNVRRMNLLSMSCYIQWLNTTTSTTSADRTASEVMVVEPTASMVNFIKLGWSADLEARGSHDTPPRLPSSGAGPRDWPMSLRCLSLSLRLLPSSIKKDTERTIELDTDWASTLWVAFHSFLRCSKATGLDVDDMEARKHDLVYCSYAWRGDRSRVRHDFVWVQEYEADSHLVETPTATAQSSKRGRARPFDGRIVGQLLAIVSVRDPNVTRFSEHKVRTAALIEVFRYRNQGRFHDIHGMVEVERLPSSQASRRRFYRLPNIHRSAHLVPTGEKDDVGRFSAFYVNPYVDWDQYNSLYDPDFLQTNRRQAEKLFKEKKWTFANGYQPVYEELEDWLCH